MRRGELILDEALITFFPKRFVCLLGHFQSSLTSTWNVTIRDAKKLVLRSRSNYNQLVGVYVRSQSFLKNVKPILSVYRKHISPEDKVRSFDRARDFAPEDDLGALVGVDVAVAKHRHLSLWNRKGYNLSCFFVLKKERIKYVMFLRFKERYDTFA